MLNVNGVLFPVTFVAFQIQPVGVFVDVSLNWTAHGAVPLVTLEVKLATGAIGTAVTLMKVTSVERADPALLLAFNTME